MCKTSQISDPSSVLAGFRAIAKYFKSLMYHVCLVNLFSHWWPRSLTRLDNLTTCVKFFFAYVVHIKLLHYKKYKLQWRIQRGRSRRAPLYGTKIFLISCSFGENLYVGAFHWRVGAPSYGKSWIHPWIVNSRKIRMFVAFVSIKNYISVTDFIYVPQLNHVNEYRENSQLESKAWSCSQILHIPISFNLYY